jgi:predicted nucleotidyltransferase
MIPKSTIDEAIRRLVKAYNPLQMYLYGDYAWGTPNEESTYDVLIIVESSNERVIKRGYAAFEALLGLEIPKNIAVFTKEEFDKYAQDPKSSTYEIKTRGKIIYARN